MPQVVSTFLGIFFSASILYISHLMFCMCVEFVLSHSHLAALFLSRYFLAVGVLQNKLYIVGGVDRRNSSLKSAECYDSEKGTWVPVASMSQPRCACV